MCCADCERFDSFQPRVSIPSSISEEPRPGPRRGRPQILEFTKAQQLVLDGEADLEYYAAEIRRLQSKILLIEQKRSRLDGYLEHYRCLAAPIWKIPDEVLGLIFEHVCDGHARLQKIGTEKPSIPVLRFSAVCSHWRAVLHSTPSFWSDFVVSFTADGMPVFDAINLFLERSKQMLLGVSILFEHGGDTWRLKEIVGHPAFLALVSQAHRWSHLELYGKRSEDMCILRPPIVSSFPELQTLRLVNFEECNDACVSEFAPMPKLRSIFGENFYPLHPPQRLPWHQLTQLTVHAMHDVPRLAQLCENLLALIVEVDLYESVRTFLPMSGAHNNMQSLRLVFVTSYTNGPQTGVVKELLEALSFPCLKCLELINKQVQPLVVNCTTDDLAGFIDKCSSALADFTLDNICISDINLIDILRKAPSLIFLTIRDPYWEMNTSSSIEVTCPLSTTFIKSLHIVPNCPILLPNLEYIYLTIRKEFNETIFVETLLSRVCIPDTNSKWYNADDERACALEDVVICLGDTGSSIFGENVDLEKLEPLKIAIEHDTDLEMVNAGKVILIGRDGHVTVA